MSTIIDFNTACAAKSSQDIGSLAANIRTLSVSPGILVSRIEHTFGERVDVRVVENGQFVASLRTVTRWCFKEGCDYALDYANKTEPLAIATLFYRMTAGLGRGQALRKWHSEHDFVDFGFNRTRNAFFQLTGADVRPLQPK